MEKLRKHDTKTPIRVVRRGVSATAIILSFLSGMSSDARPNVTSFLTAKVPVAFACYDPNYVSTIVNGHNTTVFASGRRGIVLAGFVEGNVSFTTSQQGECALFLGDGSKNDITDAIEYLGLPPQTPVDYLP